MRKNSGGKLLLILVSAVFLLVMPKGIFARDVVTEWYVKSFDAEIIVNQNGSLDVTEKIVADCGQLGNKHGIFRILPTEVRIEGGEEIETPVKLISIENEAGEEYQYSAMSDFFKKTVTWKIGDKNKTVQGEKVYVIKYQVDNAIRFYNDNFDEFYWNLIGNFWDMEMDQARIKVIFPEGVDKKKSEVNLYSGALGEKGNPLADWRWLDEHTIGVRATQMLPKKNGITLSVTFPKDVLVYTPPSLWEKYWHWIFALIPLAAFWFSFSSWRKHGKDPKVKQPRIAEYEPPKLSIMEMGTLSEGRFKNNFITAEVIYFATRGILSIKEVNEKKIIGNTKDYQFIRKNNHKEEQNLTGPERIILTEGIFKSGNERLLSDMKDNFYTVLPKIKKGVKKSLIKKGLVNREGEGYKLSFLGIGFLLGLLAFFLIGWLFPWLTMSLFLSAAIVVVFGLFMPKLTPEGAKVKRQVENFQLFMETVNKDRAKFYEKENIFEKFLPHAILFGITGLWISRIKEIYGEKYIAEHAPVWYAGSNLSTFDVGNFTAAMSSLSHSISSSTSSYSGSGGSGSSGGGGGGGGGGGW